MTLKPVQQANGKRSFKFTKASQAQPSIAKHSQAQPRIASTALHSPVQPCTALVIFSLSFRLPVALARPSLSIRSLFGCLLRLHGPRFLFALFSGVLGPLGSLFAALGPLLGGSWPLWGGSWAALGRSWALLGASWAPLGRSWDDPGTI